MKRKPKKPTHQKIEVFFSTIAAHDLPCYSSWKSKSIKSNELTMAHFNGSSTLKNPKVESPDG